MSASTYPIKTGGNNHDRIYYLDYRSCAHNKSLLRNIDA